PLFWTALVWNIFFGVMYYWIGKRVWFHGKRGDYITARDFFADLFGSSKLATFIAIILLVFTVPHLQIQLTGGAYLMEVASGGTVPFWLGGLLFYLVIIIYVWAGGVRAIAWTDIFYGVTIFLGRSEEHTSELQSRFDLVCRLLLEKKNRTLSDVFSW